MRECCDIILPTYGPAEFIRDCVESLIKSTGYPYRLIIIDNGGSKEVGDYLEDIRAANRSHIELIKPDRNIGWVRSINLGLEISTDSKYICFQNDDTVFSEGWLEELVGVFDKYPDIGIANPQWEKPDGESVEGFAKRLAGLKGKVIDADWCRGHCFFLRREVVDKIGGLDPVYIPGYYDDRDYSLKAIKAGFRCVRACGAFVYHLRNVSMRRAMDPEEVKRLMERNGNIFYKRWSYPLRLMFVLNALADSLNFLKDVCMDQNKVMIAGPKGVAVPYEHTNMTRIEAGRFAYYPRLVFNLLLRRTRKRQKMIDFVFTDDEKFYSYSRFFKPLISAKIVFDKNLSRLRNTAVSEISARKESDKASIKT